MQTVKTALQYDSAAQEPAAHVLVADLIMPAWMALSF
jgi:hypothetical protein